MSSRVPDEPSLVYEWHSADAIDPRCAVVMPVYNQESIISENIRSLADAMVLPSELVIVDDASTDASLREILTAVEMLSKSSHSFVTIKVIRFSSCVFETRCDVAGFAESTAPFLLEVQADMTITEQGFDRKMVEALLAFDDLLMLSGRGTEPLLPIAASYRNGVGTDGAGSPRLFKYVARRAVAQVTFLAASALRGRGQRPKGNGGGHASMDLPAGRMGIAPEHESQLSPSPTEFILTQRAGRVGGLIEIQPAAHDLSSGTIWVGQTVMRGPLMIHRQRYDMSGGLDPARFFLAFDDHDLACRAYRDHGLRCGYMPIGFSSPLEHGTTRRRRSLSTEWHIFRNILRVRRERLSSALFEASNLDGQELAPCEVRSVPAGTRQFS